MQSVYVALHVEFTTNVSDYSCSNVKILEEKYSSNHLNRVIVVPVFSIKFDNKSSGKSHNSATHILFDQRYSTKCRFYKLAIVIILLL